MTYNGLSFAQATQIFLESADWLTDKDQPAVTSLERLAIGLDQRLSASLMAEFTKVYRVLLNAKPEDTKPSDALDDFLVGLTR